MDERLDTLTNRVKAAVPNPNETDAPATEVYETVTRLVVKTVWLQFAAFINQPKAGVSADLDDLMVLTASNWLKATGAFSGADADEDGRVTSIKEGDTTVNFKAVDSLMSRLNGTRFLTSEIKHTLVRYRRLPGWD